MSFPYQSFDPLLSEESAAEMVTLCERFGSYGTYAEEGLNDGIGEGLPQRFDAAFNFIKSGGRFGRAEDLATLASRTNYFRETYAYAEDVAAPGIEPLLNHEGFLEAARVVHGRSVVVPAIVYANLLLPGQELAVHTDVPEFRGANRKELPQWLLVVMHHSGLFERWRMPIATGVSWFHDAKGGAFAFYPDGADAEPREIPACFNTAVLIDTDSVFHGVDRVNAPVGEIPPFRPGMRLYPLGEGRWVVREGADEVARYRWEDMRFSISWKAYCFADEAERRAWLEHQGDLTLDFIIDTLDADLRKRGRISGERPGSRELAETLVDEYVVFPPSARA